MVNGNDAPRKPIAAIGPDLALLDGLGAGLEHGQLNPHAVAIDRSLGYGLRARDGCQRR